MNLFLILFSSIFFIISGCDSLQPSSNSTADLTPSQMLALSKIHNIKGKHTSKNGSASLSLVKTIQSINFHDMSCWSSQFEYNFQNETWSQIDCVQSIDFSVFNNASMASITTSMIVVSERTDTGKKMAYYMSDNINAWFVDPKFYMDNYYSNFSSNGSFFYDYTNTSKTAMYSILYIWDEKDGVSIDLTDITKPKLSKNISVQIVFVRL